MFNGTTFDRAARVLSAVVILGTLSVAAFAQSGEPVASDLTEPRMIHYDAEGNLYIAEAGSGGETETQWGEPDVFTVPATIGGTGQVRMISADGENSVLLSGLTSVNGAPPPGLDPSQRNVYGASVALPTESGLWVAIGAGAQGPPLSPFSSTVFRLDPETMNIDQMIDLGRFEVDNDPDGAGVGTNPSDIEVADDGTVYIVDAGCNCMVSWTEAEGLRLFNAWSESPQAVPDSVDIGPDGDLYVGFLRGAPFPPDSARVERWTPAGEQVETHGGLNMVVDVLVEDDGALYVVEFAQGIDPEAGALGTESGRVLRIDGDERTVVAEGLNFPYGIARSPDGNLVVAHNAAFVEAGTSEVIALEAP